MTTTDLCLCLEIQTIYFHVHLTYGPFYYDFISIRYDRYKKWLMFVCDHFHLKLFARKIVSCVCSWTRTCRLTHSLLLANVRVDKKIYIYSEFTNSLFIFFNPKKRYLLLLSHRFNSILYHQKNPPSISFTNRNTNREIRWKFSWFIVKQITLVLVMRQHSVYMNAFSFASSNT